MPLDVIGAGLGRTGTTSLALALELLGFVRCHHMTKVIFHPETARDWERAAEGEPVDWESILAGYRATTDWPACHFYRTFAALYPRAKVILTVRDPQSWFRSTQATIFSEEHLKEVERRPMAGILSKMIEPMFDGRMHDRDHMIAVYERHNAEVRRTIAPERLLVYDVKDSWEPLCRFLGVPVPSEPFPRANTTHDFRRGRPAPGIERPPLQD
ncbi:MAG TPA: sulfotransferase [Steroidobacteraceae bacterium]|nr:sulfotransferase [Steroidobacteraceae bacterium]